MSVLELVAAALCVFGALYALGAKQLMRGVGGITLFFFGLAAFFVSLGAWYFAVAQIFLFVGGVVTLFVLAFNVAPTPVQRGKGVAAALVALAALLVLLTAFPPLPAAGTTLGFASFANGFFARYGVLLNIALLLLCSVVISTQYLLTEEQ